MAGADGLLEVAAGDGVARALARGRPVETLRAAPPSGVAPVPGSETWAPLLAGRRGPAVVVVPDATRPPLPPGLLACCLRALAAAGVAPVEVLVGVGLHRPASEAETAGLRAAGAPVRSHDPAEAIEVARRGGRPLTVSRRLAEAGTVVALGIVEPHQFAGYSGGAKGVAIGCGGEATIAAAHAVEMADAPGVALGRIEGNPFQDLVWAAAEAVPFAAAAAVVPGPAGPAAVEVGRPRAAFARAVAAARRAFEAPFRSPRAVVVAGVGGGGGGGAGKASSLYQASRAVTYLALADPSPVSDGGTILLVAPCPEGAGRGTGERRFFDLMIKGPEAVRAAARGRPLLGGEQRAYVLAKALARVRCVVVAEATARAEIEACGLGFAADLQEALDAAPTGPILCAPDATSVVPVPAA